MFFLPQRVPPTNGGDPWEMVWIGQVLIQSILALVVHKNRRPHTANLFSLRNGTACERWPVTSRIRAELPVNHVDEPERSQQPSLKITCFTKHPGLSLAPGRKSKFPNRSPMSELVGAPASPSRARRIHHPELRKTTSCANQEQ